MNYKGKREIRVDEDVEIFYGRAMSAILDDMELDFDLAVLDYADEEEMDVTIDGEEWVICFDQDEEGIHFHLITPEEFEDNYYRYAEYDDDEFPPSDDDEDFEPSDSNAWLDDDEDEFKGVRSIQADPDVSVFHIVSLATFLDVVDFDFEEAKIIYADDTRLEAMVDGERIVLTEQVSDGKRFLAPLEEEEEGNPSSGIEEESNGRIIPFRKP